LYEKFIEYTVSNSAEKVFIYPNDTQSIISKSEKLRQVHLSESREKANTSICEYRVFAYDTGIEGIATATIYSICRLKNSISLSFSVVSPSLSLEHFNILEGNFLSRL